MVRIALFALVVSFAGPLAGSSESTALGETATASRSGAAQVQTVGFRYRTYRNGAYYRSTPGRRPGTGFTPWYLLPKTDPRRYNGPHYYWK